MKTIKVSRPGFDFGITVTRGIIEIGTARMIVKAMAAVLPKTIGNKLLAGLAFIGIDTVIGYILGKVFDDSSIEEFLQILRDTGIIDIRVNNLQLKIVE